MAVEIIPIYCLGKIVNKKNSEIERRLCLFLGYEKDRLFCRVVIPDYWLRALEIATNGLHIAKRVSGFPFDEYRFERDSEMNEKFSTNLKNLEPIYYQRKDLV